MTREISRIAMGGGSHGAETGQSHTVVLWPWVDSQTSWAPFLTSISEWGSYCCGQPQETLRTLEVNGI